MRLWPYIGAVSTILLSWGCRDSESSEPPSSLRPDSRAQNSGVEDAGASSSGDHSGTGAARFTQLSHELVERLEGVRDGIVPDDKSCPPKRITLAGGKGVIEINTDGDPDYTGSDSKLFVSSTLVEGKKVIVKTVASRSMGPLKGMVDDIAFMKVFHDTGMVPRLFEIEPETLPAQCAVRTMVSEFQGAYQLKHLRKMKRTDRMKALKESAPKLIRILKAVHAEGLVHGDVHYKNFVFSDENNVAKTLRIIDFGRAMPFVDADGVPLPDAKVDYGRWNPWHLSPWELEGWRKTQRDDMFRLAETLLRAGKLDTAFAALDAAEMDTIRKTLPTEASSNSKVRRTPQYAAFVLKLKRDRPFAETVPPVYVEFYRYCLSLTALAVPDYDGWARRFETST